VVVGPVIIELFWRNFEPGFGFWWFLVEKIEIDLVDLYFNNSNKTIETTQTKLSKQQDARYY
jgi:hypothetical protein